MLQNPENVIQKKVYICSNGRCIDPETSRDLYLLLSDLIQLNGLDQFDSPRQVKCNLAGCLDHCKHGPVLVVQPDMIWYERVTPQALKEIFEEHLLNDRPVEKYVFRTGLHSPQNPSK